MRIFENNVFNTEALKFSVRRLNQLGYFKPLEAGKDVTVEKTPGATNKVDVKVKLEEQNRNQISFGAGVSEFEGFFGQASFQTSNFLGRGESLTVSLSAGSRAQNYTIAFTEPFLFDRNMTGSVNSVQQRRPLPRPVHAAIDRRRRRRSAIRSAASRGCSPTTATSASG